jgi:N6-adenosine-specific RNA methylase IME4
VYRQAQEAAHARKTAGENELRAALPEAERPRELAARMAGVSPRTVQDAITVRDADPALFARVRSGEVTVAQAAQQVRRRHRLASMAAPPLPDGRFPLLYADPPWQLGSPASNRAPENHYPTLPVDDIKEMVVPAAEDAICFLWAVNALLAQALEVLEAWGFTYRTNLVWVKDRIGLGFYARNQHELLLLGTRGTFPLPAEADRPSSVMSAARGVHSSKPEAAYELIERMYPELPRLELLARRRRAGWVAWGNEVADVEREVA